MGNLAPHRVVNDHNDDDMTEDEFYMQKIQELVNEKMKQFAREDQECYKLKIKKKKLGKKVIPTEVVSNEVTERLKEFITNDMNGYDMQLVIQKVLYSSDVSRCQNRLNMPFKQLETHDFLTDDEIRMVEEEEGPGVKVRLVGPNLRMYEEPIWLKTWKMSSTKNYVFKTNWSNFVDANKAYLKAETNIQVWSFRIDEQLCFAIACVERPDVEDDVARGMDPS
ncbi:B3 domain-containing protein, DNA-binding pseudobarrel domain protein [Artemisia annua]|uniref:B3 domain-containing protein, DNA-binding pseudobarrel domain protein n=1 Tax=Artemisia annua TaxID=35608 RepID=A0A2U1PTL1_ARTAN|nr:B3 domain-containing protein, DNA-binding pseudobarrel domain protein [Artemisia annua]